MRILLLALLALPAQAKDLVTANCVAKGTTSTCLSKDGKYGLVLADTPLYSLDFPSGLGLTDLCLVPGAFRLNGREMKKDEVTVKTVSSYKGLHAMLPDGKDAEALAVARILGGNGDFLSLPDLKDVDSLEAFVYGGKATRHVALYLLKSDGKNFSKVDLACQPAQ